MPSIVDGFCRLPSPEFAADSVAPQVCHPALAAARALLVVIGEDAQNDRKRATIPRELGVVGLAVPWPRCGVPELPRHDGRLDSLVQ
jgi:hypothetical protein